MSILDDPNNDDTVLPESDDEEADPGEFGEECAFEGEE